MIKRKEALEFINQQIGNKSIVKHMLATEAIMRALANYFLDKNELQLKEGRTRVEFVEAWAMAGLLHDADYKDNIPMSKQGVKVSQMLEEKGYEIPDSVKQAMAAHNWEETGVEPQSKMDWSLFCCDSLTGLIVATALVRPDPPAGEAGKKLSSVKVKSVMKKFKDKSFARGTRREDIKLCEEKLGIPLADFVKIGLEAMQGISDELRL